MNIEQITNRLIALVNRNVLGRINAEQNPNGNYNLEEQINDLHKNPSQLRKYLADTFAGQTFHQPLFFSIELFMIYGLGRMDFHQSLGTRRNAFGIGLFANRAYGYFGDYWEKLWKSLGVSSERGRRIVDGSGKVLFEAGLYAGNLAINRVNVEDMYVAVPLGLAIHFGLGHVYRRYQNYIRQKFGIRSTQY